MKKLFILLGVFVFIQNVQSQNWLTTGNTGTKPATNFIGTKDNQALVFKTNSAERIRILTNGNTGIGTSAALQKLDVNGNLNIRSNFALFMDNHLVLKVDSASGNAFLGSSVAPNNSGFYNTASGDFALHGNTNGTNNTASGYASLYSNTTGNYNTANGAASLYYTTTGSNNTAIGYASLYFNTTGNFNTANGFASLYFNTTGSRNTASGYASLDNNTIGFDNTTSGYSSLYSNTTGFDNTANGNYSLYSNTTGDFNTASGFGSLQNNATGNYNTANGSNALGQNTGSYNTGVGYAALSATTGALYNTAVGYNAGNFTNNGYNNVFIGANTGVNGTGYFNVVAVGQGTIATASNQARIGNSFTTSIGGYANWSNISDVRVKKNIKENVPGLVFINKLKPITYNLDLEAADRIMQYAAKDKDGKAIQPTQQELAAKKTKEQIIYTGFAAQEVEKAAKDLNYDFSGVDAAKSDKDLYGLRYSEFVVPLVKAVQELSRDNDDLKSTLSDVVAQLAEVKKQLIELKVSKSTPGTSIPANDFARLEQNVPNPFNNTTVISYYIPSGAGKASLTISNINGQVLKTISLNNKGTGSTSISAGELAAGDYFYTLFIDGKKADTKQMVLTK